MSSEGLWHKRNGPCEIWEFFGLFGVVQDLFVIIFWKPMALL
jgi:hypothetical protein